MAKESRARAAMGGSKKSSSKSKSKHHKVHKMHISHAANGGYIAEHEMSDPSEGSGPGGSGMPDMEQHIVPQGGLAQHVAENMQDAPPPAAAGGAPGGAPAPAAAGGAPPAGM